MLPSGLHHLNEDPPFVSQPYITLFLLFAHCVREPHLDVLRLQSCCACGAPVSKFPHNSPELSVTGNVIRNVGLVNVYGNGVSF